MCFAQSGVDDDIRLYPTDMGDRLEITGSIGHNGRYEPGKLLTD
jgi:hypothetical protein